MPKRDPSTVPAYRPRLGDYIVLCAWPTVASNDNTNSERQIRHRRADVQTFDAENSSTHSRQASAICSSVGVGLAGRLVARTCTDLLHERHSVGRDPELGDLVVSRRSIDL
jgi:hypothetical protein